MDLFLSREEFERLSDDEALACIEFFEEELDRTLNAEQHDLQRFLDVDAHWCEVAEWVLEPAEYEKLVTRPAWDSLWDNSDKLVASLESSLTGKLVTSAALILMFAFLVLSSSPGYEDKVFAIGLAAGIIFDATVIRTLLVPSLMKLFGAWNWWMPQWTRKALFLQKSEPRPEPVTEHG
jgi:hypothetical protein